MTPLVAALVRLEHRPMCKRCGLPDALLFEGQPCDHAAGTASPLPPETRPRPWWRVGPDGRTEIIGEARP